MADEIQNEELNSEALFEARVIKTDKGQEPYRIDKFLMNRIEGATRNKLQQSIEAGFILVNGKQVKPNHKIKAFDEIAIILNSIVCILIVTTFGKWCNYHHQSIESLSPQKLQDVQ